MHDAYGSTSTQYAVRVLAESYAEADVVALRQGVRQEAYAIFSSALEGSEHIIDTDDFVAAVRREQAEEEREP
jgi:plasmid replication initiation protein